MLLSKIMLVAYLTTSFTLSEARKHVSNTDKVGEAPAFQHGKGVYIFTPNTSGLNRTKPMATAPKSPAKKLEQFEPPPLPPIKNVGSRIDENSGVAISLRIIGGNTAKPHEFPHHLGVLFNSNKMGCGASIVNEYWVLCAAHCFEKYKAANIKVIAGKHNLKANEGTEQVIQVKEIISHEKYDPKQMRNDIALLKLSTPFKFNKNVQPVVLAMSGRKTVKGDTIVTGWGHTQFEGKFASVLQKVTIPIVSHEQCKEIYKGNALGEGQICAGVLGKGGKDACQGDSGGPMVVTDKKDKYIQVGIVSYGVKCGDPKFPGAFTEVAFYRSWIDSKITNSKKA